MKTELETYDAPEAEEVDAPGSPDEKHGADAYRQFLADKRHIRFEDTESNWEAIEGYVTAHDLPTSACALALAYEQLSTSGELELTPLARERAADERTEAEVKQAEEGEQSKTEPTPTSTSEQDTEKSARQMTAMFRKRPRMVRFKNGAQVS